jgi:hypothetical protein
MACKPNIFSLPAALIRHHPKDLGAFLGAFQDMVYLEMPENRGFCGIIRIPQSHHEPSRHVAFHAR